MTLAPGAHIGPYEVIAPVGAGGMGEGFRARDTRLNRLVAIKVVADCADRRSDRRDRSDRVPLELVLTRLDTPTPGR